MQEFVRLIGREPSDVELAVFEDIYKRAGVKHRPRCRHVRRELARLLAKL